MATETSSSTYQVFLSFRNQDIGKAFGDRLHKALSNAGLHIFRHNKDTEIEENPGIKKSEISIVVFTKNYASSSSCLDEVVKIMRTRGGRVLPVFYDVSPSDVQEQTGSVAVALAWHEKEQLLADPTGGRRNEWIEKVELWKKALKEVSDLEGGMVLESTEDRCVASFIQKIVKEVEKLLGVSPYLVGMESRIRDVDSWVKDGSTAVGVGVICGMAGIGKTTVAKMVYNLNFEQFERSSFLTNIKERSLQLNGLICLQKQLLSDILGGKNKRIYCTDEGTIKIQESLCNKRILLVLDDVDHIEQVHKMLGSVNWFCPGSKIIITTRSERLFKANKVDDHCMFKIKELDGDDSLRLFCLRAFGRDYPSEGFEELSKIAACRCGGLPLALQVLGSSLLGRQETSIWNCFLEKWARILPIKIWKTLQRSYNSLEDVHDKNLFIDIATCFVGEDKDYVVGVMEERGFFPRVGIENLMDEGLLSIDDDNKLVMNQLLQDMAKEIVGEERAGTGVDTRLVDDMTLDKPRNKA